MGGNSSRWIFYNPEKYDKELEGFNGLWSAERKRLGKPLESQETSREYWLILERGNDSLRPNVYFFLTSLGWVDKNTQRYSAMLEQDGNQGGHSAQSFP